MKIGEAARMMRASTSAGAELFDKEIEAFSIDSRSLAGGELFFALSPDDYARHGFTGTSFADAHQFIPQAFADGALAAVARRARVEGDAALAPFAERLLLVEDCIEALQVLAHAVVSEWAQPVVGITGSAGKTST